VAGIKKNVTLYTGIFVLPNYFCIVQVPRKDNEIVIISEKADSDFYNLWYMVIRGMLYILQNKS